MIANSIRRDILSLNVLIIFGPFKTTNQLEYARSKCMRQFNDNNDFLVFITCD